MNRIRAIILHETDSKAIVEKVKEACWAVHEEDLERNKTMGRLGAEWLWEKRRGKSVRNGDGNGEERKLKVITVCNTGSLATSVSCFRSPAQARGMELQSE